MATTRKTTSRTPAKKTTATKRTAANKTAAKKTAAAKKTTAKKTTAKKAAKKSAPSDTRAEQRTAGAEQATTGTGSSNGSGKLRAADAARSAAEQLAALTGRQPECVIGIEREDGGWRVDLEVVESRRIPDSTDVLAIYAVDVDSDGELVSYHRVRRYIRGRGGDGEEGRR